MITNMGLFVFLIFTWNMNILSQVSQLFHFILILSDHNEMPRTLFFAGKYLPLFH